MNVSILISCFNNKHDLELLLPSIERLNLRHHLLEVIIRDDCSTDGTADLVNCHFKWVKLIRGKQNLGFARSNNEAFKHARGDILVFVNADTIVDPDFLTEGLSIFEKFPDVVGVNPNMIMPWVIDIKKFIEMDRENVPAWEYQLTPYGYCRYVKVDKNTRKTNFMTGGGCFLRRTALKSGEDVFDGTLGKVSYCEDSDLSLRLIQRGGIIMYAPRAVIYHNQAPKKSFRRQELKKLLKITWNRFYIMAKRNTPRQFTGSYPLYLAGIIKKMDHIGLSGAKQTIARLSGGLLALPFFVLFPYWLWISLKNTAFPASKKIKF